MRAVGAARARRPNDANYRIRSGLTSRVVAARCSEPASGSAFRLAYGSATRRPRQPFVHHVPGVRHAKLTIACEWKSHPAKAVAGGPEPSLAGVAVTRGLKRRQGLYGMWE